MSTYSITSTPEAKAAILAFVGDNYTKRSEILKNVSASPALIDKALAELRQQVQLQSEKGVYSKPTRTAIPAFDGPTGVENIRDFSDNIETINGMLNLYDAVIADTQRVIEDELLVTKTMAERIDLIKSLKYLASTVDQLMKRWYLVHRGYDTNARQAQEDAKEKTDVKQRKQAEAQPPEKQITVIGSYGQKMEEIIKQLPGKVNHSV